MLCTGGEVLEEGAVILGEFAEQRRTRLMPWGTPDQLLEKIEFVHETIGAQGMMGHFSYAGMPYDEAERSLRLFVDKVMPEMQRIGTESGALMVG